MEYAVTYEAITPSSASAPNLTTLEAQPWWGNTTEATIFAEDVGTGLGLPNGGFLSPFFAVSDDGSFTTSSYYEYAPVVTTVGAFTGELAPNNSTVDYATASVVEARCNFSTGPAAILTFLALIVLRRYLRPQSAAV